MGKRLASEFFQSREVRSYANELRVANLKTTLSGVNVVMTRAEAENL